MIPRIITSSDLRKNLAGYLDIASEEIVVIKDKRSNKIIMDEREFNRLSALARQFMEEDPEGKYRPKFIKTVLSRSGDNDIDDSVSSLRDLA